MEHPSIETLDQTQLSRLMRLGINGPRRPVDALIQRLSAQGGKEWLARILQEDLPERERSLIKQAVERSATLDQLQELKSFAKDRLTVAKTENDRICSLFSYFISLAGALATHGQVITSRGADELELVLLDLAEALADAESGGYQDLVSEGGMRAAELTQA